MAADGLLVAGVGRSGTSVATRLALSLGLRGPAADDLMPANEANPDGYWESNSLAVLNDRILETWDSTWWTPPAEITADMTTRLRGWEPEASQAFESSFGPGPGWVWKDPRLTVLLGFWTRLLGPQPVLVPVRQPQAVAASIVARDRIPYERALGIWERHTRNLLRSLAGRAVLVLDYHDLLRDPGAWLGTLFDFCRAAGLPVRQPAANPAEIVRRSQPEPRGPLSDRQAELLAQLQELAGPHHRFPEIHPAAEAAPTPNTGGQGFDLAQVKLDSAPRPTLGTAHTLRDARPSQVADPPP